MGIAEIVGFAACWLVVATLMLWGVFTEKKRGPMRHEPPAGAVHVTPAPRPARPASSDWVVIEVVDGTTLEVQEQARFLAAAWLASAASTPPPCRRPTCAPRSLPAATIRAPPGCWSGRRPARQSPPPVTAAKGLGLGPHPHPPLGNVVVVVVVVVVVAGTVVLGSGATGMLSRRPSRGRPPGCCREHRPARAAPPPSSSSPPGGRRLSWDSRSAPAC